MSTTEITLVGKIEFTGADKMQTSLKNLGDAVKKTMGDMEQACDRMIGALDNVRSSMDSLVDTLQTMGENLQAGGANAQGFADQALNMFGILADGITIATGITSAITFLAQSATTTAGGLSAVGGAAAGVGSALGIVGIVIAAIVAVVMGAIAIWNLFGEQIRNAASRASGAFAGLRAAFGELFNALAPLFAPIAEIFQFIYDAICRLIRSATEYFIGFIEYLTGQIQVLAGVINLIFALLSGDQEKITQAFEQIQEGIRTSLAGIFDMITVIFTDFMTNFVFGFAALGQALIDFFGLTDLQNQFIGVFQSIYDSLPAPIQGIIGILRELGTAITDIFFANRALQDANYDLMIAEQGCTDATAIHKQAVEDLKVAEESLHDADLSAQEAILGVERAERSCTEAIERYGVESLEAREAEVRLERAKDRNVKTTTQLEQALCETGVAIDNEKVAAGNLETAQDNLSDATDRSKNASTTLRDTFNGLVMKLPHIQLPFFTIAGGFSLNPLSTPKMGVTWAAKGGILTQPTIFGINGNHLLGGGEAGPEAILPITVLKDYIRDTMQQQNSRAESLLAEMLEMLRYLPRLSNMQMVTDTGALVGALAPGLNTTLGQMDQQRARGGTWRG